jgi:mannose-6-phosphate isomerase-like protein (cupin superfamily)
MFPGKAYEPRSRYTGLRLDRQEEEEMKRIIIIIAVIAASLIARLFSTSQEQKDSERKNTTLGGASKSPVPLILQEDDGDHLVHRAGPLGGVPFTIKVDDQFGNSEDFFVFAETLAPRQTIPFHKHHNAEEILLFEDSGASVIVGDRSGKADAHSLVFIPRNTWISATNTGSSPIHLLAIFSRHGFERYMRAISVKPGESPTPLTQDELTRLRSLGHATYWDTAKSPYPPGVAHP